MKSEKADYIYRREINYLIASGNTYAAVPCNCGDRVCEHWHIFPNAQEPGTDFTEKEALIVVKALNEAKKQGLFKEEKP